MTPPRGSGKNGALVYHKCREPAKNPAFFIAEHWVIMNPFYSRAHFIQSASDTRQLPHDEGREVAFAGRSNAGKSSALNTLCSQKALARTSKTPGRTQLINLFGLDEQRRLVDLPGYGYAKVPEKTRKQWGIMIERYLSTRHSLCGLILLMDIRHPLTDHDRQMLHWCGAAGLPVHILLTKADKLKRGPAKSTLINVKNTLNREGIRASVQTFSALKRVGLDEAHAVLDEWLDLREG